MKHKIVLAGFLIVLSTTAFAQKLNVAKVDSLFMMLETKDKFMGSIAVSENGKFVYAKAIGKADVEGNKAATPATKYRIGSISKMFTSCLVFKAAEENKLTLNQTIEGYFPSLENAKKITIAHLLGHRSGIHNFTDDLDYLTYNTQAKTQQQMIEIIAKGKSDFEPGSKSDYSNSNYVLLSYILEKIYKKPYKDLVMAKIIQPLGLKNTYFGGKISIANNESYSYEYSGKWEKQPETDMSIPVGAGALVSTPTDLTQFIGALFANKIISEKSFTQMKTMQEGYGMGIFEVPFYEHPGFGHTGGIDGFGSVVGYFPEDKLAIALTSNGQQYENNDIMIGVLSSYYGKPFRVPAFATLALKTEDLDQYLGEYASADIPLKITVTKDATILMAQATGQSAFPLEATDKNKFEFAAAGIEMEFFPSENKMTLNQGGRKFTFTKK